MATKHRVIWWEPIRETLPESIEGLEATGILRPAFWLRVIGISVVVVAPLVAWMISAYPGITLPWGRLLSSLLLMPAALLLWGAFMVVFPRRIEIRPEWIHVMHGQSHSRIPLKQIDAVAIEESDGSLPRLRVNCRNRRGDRREVRFVIGRSVNLDDLAMLIGMIETSATSVTHEDADYDLPR
ncbi:MAG: hypothetical protein KJZ69_15345 [Phycisphaerales bacterium]|nr:hypothetical protein [Phycisphaerales bacterium]